MKRRDFLPIIPGAIIATISTIALALACREEEPIQPFGQPLEKPTPEPTSATEILMRDNPTQYLYSENVPVGHTFWFESEVYRLAKSSKSRLTYWELLG
jgi:hypothetical protein